MLKVENLKVEVDGKEILHDVSLYLVKGETQVLFGPNGSGKTTLLMSIMGFPRYKVTGGKIIFKDQDITRATLDERARMGIGMSFQRPPVVRGVRTRDLVRASMRAAFTAGSPLRAAAMSALCAKRLISRGIPRVISATRP